MDDGSEATRHGQDGSVTDDMNEEIRRIVGTHGRLASDVSTLSDDDDLFVPE